MATVEPVFDFYRAGDKAAANAEMNNSKEEKILCTFINCQSRRMLIVG